MKRAFIFSTVLLLLSGCGTNPESATDEVYNVEGVAIDGFDPVAYFEQGEAKKGREVESYKFNGLVYYFSSTKNRLLFIDNPDKYLPNYGGWCAYAVAETSTKMKPDPLQWQIDNGQLILFTSNFMTKLTGDLKDEWNEEPELYEARADSNWVYMNQSTP